MQILFIFILLSLFRHAQAAIDLIKQLPQDISCTFMLAMYILMRFIPLNMKKMFRFNGKFNIQQCRDHNWRWQWWWRSSTLFSIDSFVNRNSTCSLLSIFKQGWRFSLQFIKRRSIIFVKLVPSFDLYKIVSVDLCLSCFNAVFCT